DANGRPGNCAEMRSSQHNPHTGRKGADSWDVCAQPFIRCQQDKRRFGANQLTAVTHWNLGMSVGIGVTGIGMVTPVGFSAPQTCAALRAGVARFREIKDLVDSQGEPVVAARTDPADPDAPDAWSMTSMAVLACEEALYGFSKEYLAGRSIGLSI